jgi:hypothetical protein
VNHTTTIGIAAILALAALSTGAVAATAAYAGGHGNGDSFSVKSKFKQKNVCWAVDDSRTTCRNDASVAGRSVSQQSTTQPPSITPPPPPPREPECIPATVGGQTAVLSDSSCAATLPLTASNTERNAFRTACTDIEVDGTAGVVTGNGNTTPLVCTFPATQA